MTVQLETYTIVLLSLRPDQPRVEAVARRAHVENNGERVRLSGDVVLTRDSPGAQPALRVKTEMLLVLPDLGERYLSTALFPDQTA